MDVKFADGTAVALDDLIAGTVITENVGYYAGNVRAAIATSPGNLVGQGDDNVLVVEYGALPMSQQELGIIFCWDLMLNQRSI